MIRRLAATWSIPVEALVGPLDEAAARARPACRSVRLVVRGGRWHTDGNDGRHGYHPLAFTRRTEAFADAGMWRSSPSLAVARGAQRPDSDVDLLVTFQPDAPWSTLDLADLREELAALFGRQVDLVEEKAIRNPYRKASILHDRSVLYAA